MANLYLYSEIDEDLATKLLKKIDKAEEPILLHICSVGGDAYVGLALYDRIRQAPVAIHTIAQGLCGSAALTVLQAGTTRSMTESSFLYMHVGDANYGTLKPDRARQELRSHEQSEQMHNNIILRHSNLELLDIEKLNKNESYIDAKYALQLGLIDQVLKGKK